MTGSRVSERSNTMLLGRLLALGLLVSMTVRPVAPAASAVEDLRWVASWGVAQISGTVAPANSSVRNVARVSLSGEQVRIRLSNALDTEPLVVAAASIARQKGSVGPAIEPGTAVPITFDGQPGVTVQPGTAALYSDPVDFSVVANSNVAVSLHVAATANPDSAGAQFNSSYMTAADAGDKTAEESGASYTRSMTSTYAMSAIDVLTSEGNGAIVGFGSASMHGSGSTTDGYDRLLDHLITRQQQEVAFGSRKGIVGAGHGEGLNGTLNLNLAEGRLERDVLSHSGVYAVVVWVLNDLIGRTAEQVIEDYRVVIARSHAQGVRVYCPTWMPGSQSLAFRSERSELNEWIMTSAECDEVADWDRVMRDHHLPDTFKPEYYFDSIHPNALGHGALAKATPLSWFTGPCRDASTGS